MQEDSTRPGAWLPRDRPWLSPTPRVVRGREGAGTDPRFGVPRRASPGAVLLSLVAAATVIAAPGCAPAEDGAQMEDRPAPAGDSPGARATPPPGGPAPDRPPAPPPGAALASWDLSGEPDLGVALPPALEEVSGLAVDSSGTVYAHDDEVAVVYRLDSAGQVMSRFGTGRPILRADFEGIALGGGRVHLVTSNGSVVSMPAGEDGRVVEHGLARTRLGAACEVEGLAWDSGWEKLILACKTPREREGRGRLRLYHYSPGEGEVDEPPVVDVRLAELEEWGLAPELHPSAVELDPRADVYLVLASREHLLVELDRAGHLVAAVRLSPELLPQAEGLAVGPDGSLWIASEGRGGPGRLLRWDRVAQDGRGSTGPAGG